MSKLEAGVVTPIYRIPNKRKRLEGNAFLVRPIYVGEMAEFWEVEFTDIDSETRPWRWIYTAPTIKDEYVPYQKAGKKK
jgi:hypothetical protein